MSPKINIRKASFSMSFINTMYSTLEDAWGENFEQPKRRSRTNKTPVDPVCKLYNKRYNKIAKPYSKERSIERAPKSRMNEQYRKYYGYQDAHAEPRKSVRTYTARIEPPRRPMKPIDAYLEEESDDEDTPEEILDMNSHEIPEEFVYGEAVVPRYVYKTQPKLGTSRYLLAEEEEMHFEEEDECNRKPMSTKNDRIYLDMGIFTISGILLIFIMEQFIQIGMQLKTSTNISVSK